MVALSVRYTNEIIIDSDVNQIKLADTLRTINYPVYRAVYPGRFRIFQITAFY